MCTSLVDDNRICRFILHFFGKIEHSPICVFTIHSLWAVYLSTFFAHFVQARSKQFPMCCLGGRLGRVDFLKKYVFQDLSKIPFFLSGR